MHLYKCKNILKITLLPSVLHLFKRKFWRIFKNMNAGIEKKVGENIRKIRESQKITQEKLATKLQLCGCDITRSAIAKIEVGQRHLYPDEIVLIKKILNVSFDDILNV